MTGFKHTDTRVYDLDGTIYDYQSYAGPQLRKRLHEYVSRKFDCSLQEAADLSNSLRKKYSATIIGLAKEHKIDPDACFSYVYSLDVTPITLDQGLKERLCVNPHLRVHPQ